MPRDWETLATFRQVGEDIRRVAQDWTRARAHVHDFTGLGYPSTSSGGGGHGTANPVLAAVERVEQCNAEGKRIGWQLDNIARDLAEAEARIEQLRLNAVWLVRFVTRYTESVPAHYAPASCIVCANAGRTSTVYAHDRCRWHADFLAE